MLQDVEARRRDRDRLPQRRHRPLRARARRADAAATTRSPRSIKGVGALVDAEPGEVERRYANVRAAMAEHELDAVDRLRQRVHAASRAPSRTCRASRSCTATPTSCCRPTASRSIVFPTEARYVGEHGTTGSLEQVFADAPGRAGIADTARDAAGARRRLRARLHHDRARLPGARRALELVPLRRRVRPRPRGQERRRARVGARLRPHQPATASRSGTRPTRPGKTAAEVMAAAEELLRRRGLRPADDEHGARSGADTLRARVQDRAAEDGARRASCCPRSRSPGPGCTGSRSRARSRAEARRPTRRCAMIEAYDEYYEAARSGAACRARPRHDVAPRRLEGLHRPRLPPRPRHGPLDRDDDDRVPEDRRGRRDRAARRTWCFSMHPHAIAANGEDCLYMQDTWLVTAEGGVPLATLPMEIFRA